MALRELEDQLLPESIPVTHSKGPHFISFSRQRFGPGGEPLEPEDLGPRRGERQGIRIVFEKGQWVDVLAEQNSSGITDIFYRDETTNKQTPDAIDKGKDEGKDLYLLSGNATPDQDHSILFKSHDGEMQRVIVSLVPESKLREDYYKRTHRKPPEQTHR